jgi:hypothetical protein
MNDFDFFVGSWDSVQKRLQNILAGSTEWGDEFPGKSECVSLLGGAANLDEVSFPTKGWAGVTLRLFNPEREEWSLYWISSRNPVIDPPVVGRFIEGVGDFFGDDTYEGQRIRVRYRWSNITATTARWEQAFSVDNEKTWETNWIADFTRKVSG